MGRVLQTLFKILFSYGGAPEKTLKGKHLALYRLDSIVHNVYYMPF